MEVRRVRCAENAKTYKEVIHRYHFVQADEMVRLKCEEHLTFPLLTW